MIESENKKNLHILVVDDDKRLNQLLKLFLNKKGFLLSTATSTYQAKKILKYITPDLIILDVMMPNETGIEFMKKNPELPSPILMLTAKTETSDVIKGLESGADDYLRKPFNPNELYLRIMAIIRRKKNTNISSIIKIGSIDFNISQNSLRNNDTKVNLTNTESIILTVLFKNKGTPVNREKLRIKINSEINDRAIDVQINRLRNKITSVSADDESLIITVRGKGYMLI